jgi:hypothetical protein
MLLPEDAPTQELPSFCSFLRKGVGPAEFCRDVEVKEVPHLSNVEQCETVRQIFAAPWSYD